uniref:Uncharacterized protein n=1 Tax=Zea mays TaxID=4577 RepID=A0A804MZ17_MAIZE
MHACMRAGRGGLDPPPRRRLPPAHHVRFSLSLPGSAHTRAYVRYLARGAPRARASCQSACLPCAAFARHGQATGTELEGRQNERDGRRPVWLCPCPSTDLPTKVI